MEAIKLTAKILFAIFFLICISVHVLGLFKPITAEPVWSHIVHTISYCVCLYAVMTAGLSRADTWVRPYIKGVWIYIAAAFYPFVFHANCAWHSYFDYGKLNSICLLVIVMMPLAGLFIWKMSKDESH